MSLRELIHEKHTYTVYGQFHHSKGQRMDGMECVDAFTHIKDDTLSYEGCGMDLGLKVADDL